MDNDQARIIVASVQAYFPALKLPRSTVSAWAMELEALEFDVAQEAVRLVARAGTSGPVQLSDILRTAETVQQHGTRLELTGRNELHDLADDDGLDEDSVAMLDAYWEKVGGRPT